MSNSAPLCERLLPPLPPPVADVLDWWAEGGTAPLLPPVWLPDFSEANTICSIFDETINVVPSMTPQPFVD